VKVTKFLLIIRVIAINPASPGSGFQIAVLSSDRFSDPVSSTGLIDPNRTTSDLVQIPTKESNILTITQASKIPIDLTCPYSIRAFLAVILHTQDFFPILIPILTASTRNTFEEGYNLT